MDSILRVVSRLPGVREAAPTSAKVSEFTHPEAVGTTYHPVKPKKCAQISSLYYFLKKIYTTFLHEGFLQENLFMVQFLVIAQNSHFSLA